MKVDKQQLLRKKAAHDKIVALTCYDYPMARILDASDVDIALVGDSLGTNILGYAGVFEVTMQDMLHHLGAVARGAPSKFILGDMPFRSYETVETALANATRMIERKADGVKIEGGSEVAPIIRRLNEQGINVCAHIGFRPQTAVKASVQGNTIEQARALMDSALALQESGACMIVLELLPIELSAAITRLLKIPTIGIGAGNFCDGQVQVICDIMGFSARSFRHARVFAPVADLAAQAMAAYVAEVKSGAFPTAANATALEPAVLAAIKKYQT